MASPSSNKGQTGHSFLSDGREVKTMEDSLLSMLTSFEAGDFSVFRQERALEAMKTIREKQEKLSRLHLKITQAQEAGQDSSQPNFMPEAEQTKLRTQLKELSEEITKLHETMG